MSATEPTWYWLAETHTLLYSIKTLLEQIRDNQAASATTLSQILAKLNSGVPVSLS